MLILDLASTKFIETLIKIGYLQDNLFLAEQNQSLKNIHEPISDRFITKLFGDKK